MASKIPKTLVIAPAGTPAMEGACVYMKLEGKTIASTPPFGTKAEMKDVTLMGFDETEGEVGGESAGRGYDVYEESSITLLASGLELSSAKAVLVVNATCEEAMFSMLNGPDSVPMLKSFGDQKGLIVKNLLRSRWGSKNIGGGCYFFQSLDDIEAYLSSDYWVEVTKGVPWSGVTYEKYLIVS